MLSVPCSKHFNSLERWNVMSMVISLQEYLATLQQYFIFIVTDLYILSYIFIVIVL